MPDRLAIFSIKGNHYRLIVRMEFRSQRVYIKEFLTQAEYERAIAELERLGSLPGMTAEQKSLAELFTLLIEQFEQRYGLGHAEPLEALQTLLEIVAFGSVI